MVTAPWFNACDLDRGPVLREARAKPDKRTGRIRPKRPVYRGRDSRADFSAIVLFLRAVVQPFFRVR
jgi:hypothetical protein